MLRWFSSYLSDRIQRRVVLDGCSSNLRTIGAGVPQGSVLGPILFIIYINDLTEATISDLFLFADDATVLDIFKDPAHFDTKLNHDLLSIELWATKWLIDFNALKTELLTFSLKQQPSTAANLRFRDTVLMEVVCHKHLGITLNSKLNWTDHIDTITATCMKRLNILKKLKYQLPRNTINTLYLSMIRSLLEYGIALYFGSVMVLTQRLERIQYQAAIIWTGAINNTSYENLLCPSISESQISQIDIILQGTERFDSPPCFANLLQQKCACGTTTVSVIGYV
jgi:hypothetical protein